jgi:hypothetical protein
MEDFVPGDRLLSVPQSVVAAVALAALTAGALAALPEGDRDLVAILLAQTVVAIYLGFALVRGKPGELAVEIVFFMAASTAIYLSRDGAQGWLAAVFFVHAGWDLLHHRRDDLPRVGTRNVPRWYPPACLAYDLPTGIAVLMLVR